MAGRDLALSMEESWQSLQPENWPSEDAVEDETAE